MLFPRLYCVTFIVAFILFASCGSVNPWYAKTHEGWQNHVPFESPAYSFYLIGDAGKPNLEVQEPVLKLLNTHLLQANENSMVVFLGDNIYEEGMPALNHMHRERQEQRINESIKAVKGYAGTVLFIPGNHDWYAANDSMPDGLFYEREYLEEKLGNENVFLPKDGKPGPAVLQVSDSIVLVVLDSYRWIRDLPKPVRKGKQDEQPTTDFQNDLQELMVAYKDKQIVMVAHHPLFTNGGHGGYSSFAEHIFPLRVINKKLWVPLPVLGSLLPLARKFGGVIEDTPHKRYRQYIRVVLDAAKNNKDLVFAAGHEHSLQYFNKEQQHFIVSGAGSKSSWVRKGKGAGFTHIAKGFCRLDVYEDGAMWVTYFEPVGDGSEETITFRWQLVAGTASGK